MLARPLASETGSERAVCRLKCSVVANVTAGPRRGPRLSASDALLARASCFMVRDEPGAAAAGGKADGPPDEDQEAVLEAHEVEEVHDQPGDPGQEAAQLEAL